MTVEKLKTIPSFEDVRSVKVARPKSIAVISTVAASPGLKSGMIYRTLWGLDYKTEILEFLLGAAETILSHGLMMPWEVSDGHLRAARKVAAAALGLRRFRRPVRMYDAFEGDTIFLMKTGKKQGLYLKKEDAELWAFLKKIKNIKVDPLKLEDARKLYPKKTQSQIIELAQENSMRVRAVISKLIFAELGGIDAKTELKRIEAAGFSVNGLYSSEEERFEINKRKEELMRLLKSGSSYERFL
jgi:hypothetical protein